MTTLFRITIKKNGVKPFPNTPLGGSILDPTRFLDIDRGEGTNFRHTTGSLDFLLPMTNTNRFSALFFIALFILMLGNLRAENNAGYDFSIDPTEEQQKALADIRGKIPGFIVFESNRDGDWQLYRINADGTGFKQLTDRERGDPNEPMHATISPDGKTIAWEHRPKDEGGQVWLMNADGSNKRRLYAEGTYEKDLDEESTRPSFLPDGRLKFSRNGTGRNQHIVVFDWNQEKPEIGFLKRLFGDEPELADGVRSWEETLVLDFEEADLKLRRIEVRDVTPDLEHFVAFSKYPGRGTWRFSMDGEMQEKIQGGCSPRIMPDGENFVWVMIAGTFGIGTFGEPLQTQVLFDGPYPDDTFNHGYFPFLTANYRWLVFAACPKDQHDHNSANYQVMIAEMDENLEPKSKATRLTFSSATDRYPIMWTPDMYDAVKVPEISGAAHETVLGPGDFD